jgi:hypothetical protein
VLHHVKSVDQCDPAWRVAILQSAVSTVVLTKETNIALAARLCRELVEELVVWSYHCCLKRHGNIRYLKQIIGSVKRRKPQSWYEKTALARCPRWSLHSVNLRCALSVILFDTISGALIAIDNARIVRERAVRQNGDTSVTPA